MTRIQAHRGASCERPENTLSAFRRAIELGAGGIELDVHLLPDGELVVHHDDRLGRCEPEAEGSLYHNTADQLARINAGGRFSPQWTDGISRFSEVLDLIAPSGLYLNVEIKANTGFLNDIAARTIAMLRDYGMEGRSIISSFNHFVLKQVRQLAPEMPTGVLYSDTYGQDMVAYACRHGFQALPGDYHLVVERVVTAAHAAGLEVNVWTVDEPEDIRHQLSLGVDNLISNNPALALELASGR